MLTVPSKLYSGEIKCPTSVRDCIFPFDRLFAFARIQLRWLLIALISAVAELGRMIDVPAPAIDLVYGLARQRAVTAGVWPGD